MRFEEGAHPEDEGHTLLFEKHDFGVRFLVDVEGDLSLQLMGKVIKEPLELKKFFPVLNSSKRLLGPVEEIKWKLIILVHVVESFQLFFILCILVVVVLHYRRKRAVSKCESEDTQNHANGANHPFKRACYIDVSIPHSRHGLNSPIDGYGVNLGICQILIRELI
jgi:hypothetical protein